MLNVRKATFADARLLAQTEAEIFSDAWDEKSFETVLENPSSAFYIAEEDGVFCGYAGQTVIEDECEIINIAVLPEFRRRGIARRLMEIMLDGCRESGVTHVYLEHRCSNTAAGALYESLGFKAYAVRRNYYVKPREDALMRVLVLNDN